MSDYSFPKRSDDLKSRLVYTVAAEFIYRLDEFLAYEHSEAEHGPLPLDTIAVVKHCCEAAIGMFSELPRTWAEGSTTPIPALEMPAEHLRLDSPMAAKMILEAMEVLTARLPETPYAPMPQSSIPAKWELMLTLGTEFFVEFGVMTEAVLSRAAAEVNEFDVEMLRACLDSAMGMVYELKSVPWPEGQEVPARALLAMHDHVMSVLLEDSGCDAERLIQNFYDAVTRQVVERR